MNKNNLNNLLSSNLTYLFKYIFFPFSLFGFGIGIILAFYSPESIPAEWNRNIFGIGMLLGFISIATMYIGVYSKIKRVIIDDNTLLISNFHYQIKTPIKNIKSISGSLLLYPELIWLTFYKPTPFGNKIVFIGQYRIHAGWNIHPVVHDLRKFLILNNSKNIKGA
jgi:hypothetical protein